ncbi:MAG: hypothetical protein ACRDFX_10160 [Chloroflexota bacterium]
MLSRLLGGKALAGSLAVLLGFAGAGTIALAQGGARQRHVTTIHRIYSLCLPSPARESGKVVTVRGFYRILPLNGPNEQGVMYGHAVTPASAYQLGTVPLPGTDKRRVVVILAKDPLVVRGPVTLSPPSVKPQTPIPEGVWVRVRGTLHCLGLNTPDSSFVHAKRVP